jgi:hypothetical protein
LSLKDLKEEALVSVSVQLQNVFIEPSLAYPNEAPEVVLPPKIADEQHEE